MKVLLAALFILGALAAVLCGWGLSGWQAVRTEQAMVRAQAHDAAADRARVGAEAASRIAERLRAEESMRPYFHYQNLFHDPRGSDVDAVAPSPLADGPADPLVAGHFQIRRDLAGALDVTVPTINDVLPELSAPDRLAADTARRAALRLLAPQLVAVAPSAVPTSSSTQVATTTSRTPQASAEVARIDAPNAVDNLVGMTPRPDEQQQIMQVPLQFELSENQYLQNVAPEQVYSQTRDVAPNAALAQQATYMQAAQARVAPTPTPTPVPRKRTTTTSTSTTIAITVPPLQWVTLADDADDSTRTFALRQVATPEGDLLQGFELDRARLEELVHQVVGPAASGDRYVMPLVTQAVTTAAGAVPVPGLPWAVVIDDRVEQAQAAARADALRGGFLGRFVPIAALATLCGLLGIVVVARAERLARDRSQFAAAAAHELRTPLAGIQLYGDMLADGLGDPRKTERYAGRVAEDAARLGRVVANVLGFAQLERGNLHVAARPSCARDAAARAIERIRPAMTRAGVEVVLADGASVLAAFDDDALARILGNLLDNAEKYGRDAAVRRIEVAVAPVAGGRVEIRVRDHGPGVSATVARRLFRPFRRGVTADGPNGLGLGLSMSRALARAMGGDLRWVPPASGEPGAQFVVTLAAAPSGADALPL